MNRFLIGVAAATSLAGCVTLPPKHIANTAAHAADTTEYPGQATFYVMRGNGMAGMVWPIDYMLDGTERVSLRRESFARIPVPSGVHELRTHINPLSASPDLALNGTFEAGKSYWFLFDTHIGATTLNSSLRVASPEEGRALTAKYLDATPLPSSSPPVAGAASAASSPVDDRVRE